MQAGAKHASPARVASGPGRGAVDAVVAHKFKTKSEAENTHEVRYTLTPNTVELMPTRGALFPRGGPSQEPVLTSEHCRARAAKRRFALKSPAVRRTS